MKTALVVDDSSSIRSIVTGLLDQEGFRTVEASDGLDALDRAEEVKPDVVITDLHMPSLDGIGLISQLRSKQEFKFIPMLMLTSDGSPNAVERGREAGATGWLVKPIKPESLIEAVRRLVH